MPDHQNSFDPFLGGSRQLNGPLCMRQGRTCLFYEDLAGIREFDQSSFFAFEEMQSIVLFQLGDQFAQRRLADIQSVSEKVSSQTQLVRSRQEWSRDLKTPTEKYRARSREKHH
jgi:hypothetical protein